MRFIPALAVVILALSFTACVPSLHPLYTNEDVLFDPALLGVWGEADCRERWTFTQAGEAKYKLIHTDKEGVEGEFSVRLVNVAGYRFLDLLPVEGEARGNDFYQGHFQPIHTFVRVTQSAPELRLANLEPDWLSQQLKANPAALRHERIKGEIVLTASPKELQRFLLTHLQTPGAFDESLVLTRQ